MEMARSRSGGGKVVTFDDAVAGRRRNGGSLSSYLDIGNNKDAAAEAARAARPFPAPGMGSRRRTYADDGELDVFAAERYFKGAMDGDSKEAVVAGAAAAAAAAVETAAAARPAEAVVMARPSSTRASTASSASSAANSQTALFRGGGGGHRRRGRRCCVQVGVLVRTCSGKRSVRVDDGRAAAAAKEAAHGGGGGEPASSGVVDWYRELRMQKAALGLPGDVGNGLPPSLNLGTAKVAATVGREMTLTTTREEKAAAELACSSSVRRSVTLVAPVRASNSVPPASGRAGGDSGGGGGEEEEEEYDGGGSESSSDLFEIKSLMIEECCPYEPSEASIQWSIVTASAAADVASEQRGDRVGARWVGGGGGGRGPVAAGRQYRDHRPVGLLAGCASHRAVDVSAATKAVPAVQRRGGDGFQKARNGGA